MEVRFRKRTGNVIDAFDPKVPSIPFVPRVGETVHLSDEQYPLMVEEVNWHPAGQWGAPDPYVEVVVAAQEPRKPGRIRGF